MLHFIFKQNIVYLYIQLSFCLYTARCKFQRPLVSEKPGLSFDDMAPNKGNNIQWVVGNTRRKTKLYEVVNVLIILALIIIVQCIGISNHYIVHFKYIQLHVSIIPH